MINELVSGKSDLLVYKGEAYKLPLEVTLVLMSEFGNLPDVQERAEKLLKEQGIEKDKEKGYVCDKCGYNSDESCTRKLNENEPQMLTYFYKKEGMAWFDEKITEYIARHSGVIIEQGVIGNPCPVYAAFLTAMIELGKLDKFHIGKAEVDLNIFPSMYEITPGKGEKNYELEAKAQELYQKLSKEKKE
jgi:hypothetical protein